MSTRNTDSTSRPFEDELAALLATLSTYGGFVHEVVGDAGERLWVDEEGRGPDKLFAFEVQNPSGERWLVLLVWKSHVDGTLTGALVRSADIPIQYEDEAVTLAGMAAQYRLAQIRHKQWEDVLDLVDELIGSPILLAGDS